MVFASLGILGVVYTTVIATLVLLIIFKRRPKSNEPPMVPYWIPFIGSGLSFKSDPEVFLRNNHKKYGPVFTCYMGGKYYHFLNDPFTFASVAKERKRLCFRKFTIEFTKKIFGIVRRPAEVPTSHGTLTKYLQGQELEEFQEKMMGVLTDTFGDENLLSKDWKERGLFDLLFSIMFHAEIDVLFGKYKKSSGKTIGYEERQKVKQDFETFDNAFPLIAQGYPYSSCKGFLEARERNWKFLDVEKFEEKDNVAPFIEQTVANRLNEGGSNFEAAKDVYALLWAAAANTNTSVFWSIYFMITHPDALKAAEKEIGEHLEKSGQTGMKEMKFTRAELDQMIVLNSIAYEAMRLTVSSASPRQATQDLDLNIATLSEKVRIRKDDMMMVAFQCLHMDEDIYSEPKKFKYDRFINPDGSEKTDFYKNGKPVKQYVQPFGMGLSKCPGRYWAMTELKQAIILFITHMEFELVNPKQEIFRKNDRFMMGALSPSQDPVIRYRRKELF